MALPKNFHASILQQEAIFCLIVQQLEKDFGLAGIPFLELKTLSAENLIPNLSSFLEGLLLHKSSSIHQLLYTLDISEQEVNKALFDGTNSSNNYKTLALLILHRVWKKVYFRKTMGQ